MTSEAQTVVLGLGNVLCGDDGAGIHALHALQAQVGVRHEIEWVDGGVMGLELLPLVETCGSLLVLDAVDAARPAGSIIERDGSALARFAGIKLSGHQVGFQEAMAAAALRGRLPPRLILVGVQPADISVGIGLSEPVGAALPELLDRAACVLQRWETERQFRTSPT